MAVRKPNSETGLRNQLKNQQTVEQAAVDQANAALKTANAASQRASKLRESIAGIAADASGAHDAVELLNTTLTAILKDFEQAAGLFQSSVQAVGKAARTALGLAKQASSAETEFAAAAAVAGTEVSGDVVAAVQNACDETGSFARAAETFAAASIAADADANARALDLPDVQTAAAQLKTALAALQKANGDAASAAGKQLTDANKTVAATHTELSKARSTATKAEASLAGTNAALAALPQHGKHASSNADAKRDSSAGAKPRRASEAATPATKEKEPTPAADSGDAGAG